ncbi:MAG: VIT1/CCC1 transporter family protein [Candidatus Aenigmarchaeota archaeon]|nr:VIT1/CCC1 transporter family protein [Candidatus Aenigmarchaeota archaeon]
MNPSEFESHRIYEQSKVNYGQHIRDFIFGFNDGIITTLAIVAALTATGISNLIIIFAGMANILADGISMSLGGYISSKSQVEVYKKIKGRERKEIEKSPDAEREEIMHIYMQKGFRGKTLEKIVKTITSKKERWLDVMMKEELGLVESSYPNPLKVGIIIFIAFLIGGGIPLVPYFFNDVNTALIIALTSSFASIFILGSLKSMFTQIGWLRSGLEMLVIGVFAASVAYFIGGAVHYFI